jgi:uncharacterized protein YgbK (DUF1537 family)
LNSLPDSLLVAWYGDDFTGAAAVMEVLTFAGIPAMLFLDVPTQDQLARYQDVRAIGVASTARTQSPAWMDRALPPAFAALLALNPELLHYKICSTLDSSPSIGSIGRAIEIAADLIEPQGVPVVVAAPQIRRYQSFGHLFAAAGDAVYRLDRHPVMSRHPITPMSEPDVARHIAQQSNRLAWALWSLEDMTAHRPPQWPQTTNQIPVLAIDCIDTDTEAAVGDFLWNNRAANRFVVGSQGIEYALVRYWANAGLLAPQAPLTTAGRTSGMVVISGSVSPTTAEQIAWSRAHNFETIRFDVLQACVDDQTLIAERDRVVTQSLTAIAAGLDPLIFTAEGPDDPTIAQLQQVVTQSGKKIGAINQTVGVCLGQMLHRILSQSGLRRAVVSGGDTSGHATRQLGIFALSALAPTIQGAALFKAHADGAMNGLELALKGGQMGSVDYFGWIRDGGGLR